MRHLLLAITAMLLTPFSASAAAPELLSVPTLSYTERTLANGMRLYTIPDARASTVSVHTWYGVGAKDDPQGRTGFTHLFEHLMFKSTRNLPEKGISGFVDDIGGLTGASTWFHYTNYYVSAPPVQLEALLWLEAERHRNIIVNEKNFHSERDVVKEELRQRVFAAPYGRILYELMPRATYTNHPMARPIVGTIEDLDAATLEDVRAFHEYWYRPDNAVIVVAGKFDPADLDRWADRYLGSIPRPGRPLEREVHQEPERTEPISFTAYAPNVPLPAIFFAWHAPPAAHPDTAEMLIIETALGQGDASRLRRTLMHERQVASDIQVWNLLADDGGVFAPVITLAEGADIAETERLLTVEIERLRTEPMSSTELVSVKNRILADALRTRETMNGRAYQLGDGVMTSGDPELWDKRLSAVTRATAEDVLRVARRYLAPDRRASVRYLDEGARPKQDSTNPVPPLADSLASTLPRATLPPVQVARPGERETPPIAKSSGKFVKPALAERTLDNGLRVVIATSTDIPLATVELAVAGGEAADPVGREGTADLLAELLTRGTHSHSAEQFAAEIDASGGAITSEAVPDGMRLSLTGPADTIARAGALMAEAAVYPTLADNEASAARTRLIASLKQEKGRAITLGLREATRHVFAGNRYGRLPTEASLTALTQGDIAAFYRRWWRPDRAALVITGALSAEEGFALAERLFGSWTLPATPPPPLPATTIADSAPRNVAIDLPGSGQAAVLLVLPGPRRADPDYAVTNLASTILGGGAHGWIYQKVRTERGLSYGGGTVLDARRDGGMVLAFSTTKNRSAPEVAKIIRSQLERIGTELTSPDELARRKMFMVSAFNRGTETTARLANQLSALILAGLPPGAIGEEIDALARLSAEDARTAGATIFALDEASLVVVGDTGQFLDELKRSFPDIKID